MCDRKYKENKTNVIIGKTIGLLHWLSKKGKILKKVHYYIQNFFLLFLQNFALLFLLFQYKHS